MQHRLPDFFPDRTAARLYVEIMEHKYFMSEKEKKDVGLIAATRSFVKKYAGEASPPMLGLILRELRLLFRRIRAPLQTMYY